MKKVLRVLLAGVLVLMPTAALAADAMMYEDTELGFSFELPEGMEYYGDIVEETKAAMGALESDQVSDAMAELEQSFTKQPVYIRIGETSADEINILYMESSEAFDKMEKVLPDGVMRDEIDLYLMPEKDRQERMDEMLNDMFKKPDGFEAISSGMQDFGGRLFGTMRFKMFDPAVGVDAFKYLAFVYYRDYVIFIFYANYNMTGDLTAENAYGDFEAALDTLQFDVVPADKDARLKLGIDWGAVASDAIIVAVPFVVIALIAKAWRKKKKNQINIGDRNGN